MSVRNEFEFEGKKYRTETTVTDVDFTVRIYEIETGDFEWEERIPPKWWKALPRDYLIDEVEKSFKQRFLDLKRYAELKAQQAKKAVNPSQPSS